MPTDYLGSSVSRGQANRQRAIRECVLERRSCLRTATSPNVKRLPGFGNLQELIGFDLFQRLCDARGPVDLNPRGLDLFT